jgi:hypothetical protein
VAQTGFFMPSLISDYKGLQQKKAAGKSLRLNQFASERIRIPVSFFVHCRE